MWSPMLPSILLASAEICLCPLGLQGFPGGTMVKNPAANAEDMGSIPGLGRYPWGRNGYLLQYSCLGNPMDRGVWQVQSTGSHTPWSSVIGPYRLLHAGCLIFPSSVFPGALALNTCFNSSWLQREHSIILAASAQTFHVAFKKKKQNPGVLPLYMVLPGRVAQRYLCSQTPQVYLVVSILPFCQTVPQEGAGIGLRRRCFPSQGTHPSSVLTLYFQSCPKDSFIKNFFVEIQFTYIKVHKS